MPTTRTPRMEAIADELEQNGNYTAARSVRALAAERDALYRSLLEQPAPGGRAMMTRRMDALALVRRNDE